MGGKKETYKLPLHFYRGGKVQTPAQPAFRFISNYNLFYY